jgi:hypothetical protein
MQEDAAALGVPGGNLEYKLASLLDYHVRWPKLDIDSIDLSLDDWKKVRTGVISVWEPGAMFWMIRVDLPQRNS